MKTLKKSIKRQNKKAKKRLMKQAAKESKKIEAMTANIDAESKESCSSDDDRDE